MEFVTATLSAREYPETASVRPAFERLLPLLRFLITTRGFGEPAITVDMPGLQVDLQLNYDPSFDEDVTPPDVALLDRLTESDVITITLRNAVDVVDSMRGIPAAASTKSVRFELRDAIPGDETKILPEEDTRPGYPPSANGQDADAGGPADRDTGGDADSGAGRPPEG
jgi:hypothetical protein